MLELIFGLIILGIAIFISFKVLHSVAIGLGLILLIFLASYLIFGSFPNLQNTPIIGKYFSDIPKTTEEAIGVIKDTLYSIEILSVSRDSDNNLLVTVANTGKMDATDFNVFVNNTKASILNNPKTSLKSGEVTVIQIDWKQEFDSISVQTDKNSDTYTE